MPPETTSCWTASTAPRAIPTTPSTSWNCGSPGRTLLQGYHNQVLTSADGMVEPAVAMDAALLHCDVVGPTATGGGRGARGGLLQLAAHALPADRPLRAVVDDLAFRTDSQNMKVATTWQVPGGSWNAEEQAVRLPPDGGGTGFELRSCDVQEVSPGAVTHDLERRGPQGSIAWPST